MVSYSDFRQRYIEKLPKNVIEDIDKANDTEIWDKLEYPQNPDLIEFLYKDLQKRVKNQKYLEDVFLLESLCRLSFIDCVVMLNLLSLESELLKSIAIFDENSTNKNIAPYFKTLYRRVSFFYKIKTFNLF